MDTKVLLQADFAAEKRGKKGQPRELTPEEKQLISDKEAAREIVKQCCNTCAAQGTEMCDECYAIYQPNIKRFWLARYKKAK